MAKNNDLPKLRVLITSSDSSDDEIMLRVKRRKLAKSSVSSRHPLIPKNGTDSGKDLQEKKEVKTAMKFSIFTGQIKSFNVKKKAIHQASTLESVVNENESSDDDTAADNLSSTIKKRPLKKSKRATKSRSRSPSPIVVIQDTEIEVLETSETNVKEEANSLELDDFECEMIPAPLKARDQKLLRSFDAKMNFFEDIVDLHDSDDVDETDEDGVINIRINCASRYEKFQMRMDQEFDTIINKLALILSVDKSDITLYRDQEVIQPYDTPLSRNITASDNIICSTAESGGKTANVDDGFDCAVINLQIQSNIEKRKIVLKCHKNKPLQELAETYADLKNIDVDRVIFKIDGDLMDLDETARDYDLENGDCIDVLVK